MEKRNIVVLASGTGSTLQALIDATNNNILNGVITGIVSDKENSGAIQIAYSENIPSATFIYKANEQTREQYDEYLATIVHKYNPDIVVLAGWMRIGNESIYKSISDNY